jgi:hypothetical protein
LRETGMPIPSSGSLEDMKGAVVPAELLQQPAV